MKPLLRLSFLSLLLVIAACGGDENPISEKKKELEKAKQELAKAQAEVAKIEKELLALDTTNASMDGLVAVEVKALAFEPFYHTIEVSGSLESDQNLTISPEISGQVKAVFVKEGDRVSRGQTLAQLNTSTLESNIQEVRTSLDLANTLFEKQKKLWEQKIGSEMQYLEAKNRKESLENRLSTLNSQLALAYVKAPVDGVVDAIYKKEGELVMPGTPFIQLVNLDQMKMSADVSESYLKAVDPGDTVRISFPGLGGEMMHAPVTRTSNIINLKNRSFTVEVRLPNPTGTLKPNMIGIMEITDFYNDSSLVVPTRALSKDSRGDYLYVVKQENGKSVAIKTRVTPGRSSKGFTRILSGLAPGDHVITKGFSEVADRTPVNIKATHTQTAAE